MSQFSNFSDIIPAVDDFIHEQGISEDMTLLEDLTVPGESNQLIEEDFKPMTGDFFPDFQFLPQEQLPVEFKFPPSEPHNLCNDDYPGPFNFEVLIVPNGQKTPWEYSVKLNKIFIGMGCKFPVAFSVQNRHGNLGLFVRATPAYTQPQFFQELVHRCIAHEHAQDPSNKDFPEHVYQHIIRCHNPATRYFGDKNTGSRLSLALPLTDPQAGMDTVKEFFYFVCKNSCVQGMNRRPVEVIFTLEDENGRVLGRRVVCVRICSCPKRDKEKEEKDSEKANPIPQGKKRKLVQSGETTVVDTRVFALKVNIVGKKNYLHALKSCQTLMAGQILELEGRKGADAPFRKCHKEISAILNKAASE